MKELGTDTLNVMRSIKRALDPHWLMNPGKIFDVTDMVPAHDEAKATAASTLKSPEEDLDRDHDHDHDHDDRRGRGHGEEVRGGGMVELK